MRRVESVDVNSEAKAKRIVTGLKAAGRVSFYETFFDFDGAFYVVFYYPEEV